MRTEDPSVLHVLYRMFDSTGRLLYVGITANVETRMSDHRHDKPWWPDVATIRLEHFTDRDALERAERLAIVEERPRHNLRHRYAGSGHLNARGLIGPAPHRNVRIRDAVWDGFGAAVGARARSAVLNDFMRTVIRDPAPWVAGRELASRRGEDLWAELFASLREYVDDNKDLLPE